VEIVIDTSALIAVIVDEPERGKIIEITKGGRLVGPGSIPWEIGNAFSAMYKQKRITHRELQKALAIYNDIPIRFIPTDFIEALHLAEQVEIYAYDAYFIECAIKRRAPLLTLDRKLKNTAMQFDIEVLEV